MQLKFDIPHTQARRIARLGVRHIDDGFNPDRCGAVVGLHRNSVNACAGKLNRRATWQGSHIQVISLFDSVHVNLHVTYIVRPGRLS